MGGGGGPSFIKGTLIYLADTAPTTFDELPLVNTGGSFTELTFSSTPQDDKFRVEVTLPSI